MPSLLLDTCAIIWIANGEPFDKTARHHVNIAAHRGQLFVSPISAWEVGLLIRKNRLALTAPPADWFDEFTRRTGALLSALAPRVLVSSSFLPGSPPRDPADRILAATARAENMDVVTRDRLILDYAAAGHIRALEC